MPWQAGKRRAPGIAAPVLLCAAYAIPLLCGGGATPPFAAPDEVSHYLRALGLSGGRLIGEPYAYPVPAGSTMHEQRVYAWLNQAVRMVRIPAGLYAPNLNCNGGRPTMPAACFDTIVPLTEPTMQPTQVGNYQPLAYILPGLAARLGHYPLAADWLGRFAAGLTCWAFFAAACWLMWGGNAPSLAGLLLAVTPMALCLAASLTPSGAEIAAGVAFAASLLRLWREPQPGNVIWLAAGLSGATLALSRSTGPLYVGLDLLVLLGLIGVRQFVRRVVGRPIGASLAVAILAVGVLLSLA